MSLFSQALSHKATMLSIDAESQVNIDDIDTQTPIEEVHAEISNDMNQMEKHIDDLEASQQAEVTLESLSAVLKKSLRNGGMTQVELETFAICQSAIGQTLKVSVSATPDLQSYGRLGSYEYTALSVQQTAQAKKGIKERVMLIIRKIGEFIKRIWQKLTMSRTRLAIAINHTIMDAQELLKLGLETGKKLSPAATIRDPAKIQSVINKLGPWAATFNVNTLRLHLVALEKMMTHLIQITTKVDEISVAYEPYTAENFKDKIDGLVADIFKEAETLGPHGGRPLFTDPGEGKPLSERLKFWKPVVADKDLPSTLEVLTVQECLDSLKIVSGFLRNEKVLNGLDEKKVSQIFAKQVEKAPEMATFLASSVLPPLVHAASQVQMYTLEGMWAIVKYARWSISLHKQELQEGGGKF